jgi:two-component system alkaline phosphatase synthesis response regulator PhoP
MKETNNQILIADNEKLNLELLADRLTGYGFDVKKSRIGLETIQIAKQLKPDLILLVSRIGGEQVLKICEEIRKIEQLKNAAIALVGFRADEHIQIAGFEAGADDYIYRPSIEVLVYRLRALSKRISRIN